MTRLPLLLACLALAGCAAPASPTEPAPAPPETVVGGHGEGAHGVAAVLVGVALPDGSTLSPSWIQGDSGFTVDVGATVVTATATWEASPGFQQLRFCLEHPVATHCVAGPSPLHLRLDGADLQPGHYHPAFAPVQAVPGGPGATVQQRVAWSAGIDYA